MTASIAFILGSFVGAGITVVWFAKHFDFWSDDVFDDEEL